MRLPELGEKAVEVHPLPIGSFSNGSSDDFRVSNENVVGGDVNCNPLEVSMFGCNRLECRDNPHQVHCFEPEYHFFEFCCLREVDRIGRRILCPNGGLSEVLIPEQKPKERTRQPASDINAFEGI